MEHNTTSYHHIYTATRKVLVDINTQLLELGDWKYFDILIFKHKGDHEAIQPRSYEELAKILKDIDSVYSFNRVETNKHGAVAYDIIIEG